MIKKLTFQARYACLLSLFLLPSYGALITYSDRPTFNSAAPGLPTETFASGLVAPMSVTTCTGPLSSTRGDACFPTGSLLPGVVYSATGTGGGSMAVIGTGFSGLSNTNNLLGPNIFGDTFNLAFTQASAVGFDVFAGQNAGNVLISVYNPMNALLGAFTVSAPMTGTFFGVTSNAGLIGSITILSQAVPPGEVITNLSFGVSNSAVPEPCSLLLSGAGFIGIVLWRRQKRSPRS
jgi:hypothetical protein